MEVDFNHDLAEPALGVRRNVTHVVLSMFETYRFRLSREEMEMNLRWAVSDPSILPRGIWRIAQLLLRETARCVTPWHDEIGAVAGLRFSPGAVS